MPIVVEIAIKVLIALLTLVVEILLTNYLQRKYGKQPRVIIY